MFGNGIVDPMLENLIKQMLLDINTMLSLYDYDLEHYTVTARETEQSLDLSNVNLVDVESEKLFSVLRSVLDKILSDDIVNEYVVGCSRMLERILIVSLKYNTVSMHTKQLRISIVRRIFTKT